MRFCTAIDTLDTNDLDVKLLDIDATVKDVARIKTSRVSNKIGTAV
jgi:hypothetical protein